MCDRHSRISRSSLSFVRFFMLAESNDDDDDYDDTKDDIHNDDNDDCNDDDDHHHDHDEMMMMCAHVCVGRLVDGERKRGTGKGSDGHPLLQG